MTPNLFYSNPLYHFENDFLQEGIRTLQAVKDNEKRSSDVQI